MIKLHHPFFQNKEKLNYAGIRIWEILEDYLWKLYTCNIYIVTAGASDFKHLEIYLTNFYQIRQTLWFAKIPYLA